MTDTSNLLHKYFKTMNSTQILNAIKARINGEFDHPELLKTGFLTSDPLEDITQMIKTFDPIPQDTDFDEMLSALKGMVMVTNELTHKMGSYQVAWISEYTAAARNAIQKAEQ